MSENCNTIFRHILILAYDDSLKSEGIVNIICVSKYELKQMIKNKQISDGYTLAALQLLEVETTED